MNTNWNPLSKSKLSKKYFYYKNKQSNVFLYKGDALELLKSLPANSIDMIFADPPYFGNQSKRMINRTDGHKNSFNTNKAKWAYKKDLAIQFDFHNSWLNDAQRILKEGATIWITGTYHSIGVINVVLQDHGFKLLNEIVLYKKNAPPNFTGTRFRAVTETMLWAKKNNKGKTRFNYWLMKDINGGIQMHNIWEFRAKKNPFRHPATKQPFILERCLLASSNKDDIILDPFAGSGTTGFVAQSLNRNCILIEKSQKYCELIKKRIDGDYGLYESVMIN